MNNLLENLQNNVSFILVSTVLMVVVFIIAKLFEQSIEKKNGIRFSSEKTRVNKLVIMAMLSAISVLLMYFEFPLTFIAPSFYEMDLSEVPIMIGAFMLGPCSGVIMEAVKILLKLCIKGTSTAFVGDFANFILGCAFVLPASIVYHYRKTKERAVIGLIMGGIVLVIAATLMNAFYLLPKYSELYGIPVESFIKMGQNINAGIDNIVTFVLIAVAPFNVIKAVLSGTMTMILYKYLSRHLKY